MKKIFVVGVTTVAFIATLSAYAGGTRYAYKQTMYPGQYYELEGPWLNGFYDGSQGSVHDVTYESWVHGGLPMGFKFSPQDLYYPGSEVYEYTVTGVLTHIEARLGLQRILKANNYESGYDTNNNGFSTNYQDYCFIRLDDYYDTFTEATNHNGYLIYGNKYSGALQESYSDTLYTIPSDTDCFSVAWAAHQGNSFDIEITVLNKKKVNLVVTEGTVPHAFTISNVYTDTIIPDLNHDTKFLLTLHNSSETVFYTIKASRTTQKHGINPRGSKTVKWINYTAPMPKGDDADGGSQPNYYPVAGVDNVSCMPGVSLSLFSVNTPIGPSGISPGINYTPPTFTKTRNLTYMGGGVLDATTYSISANPSSFGYCWSSSLTPCGEHNASQIGDGTFTAWEHSLSFKNAPVPGASFYGGYQQFTNLPAVAFEPEPLTRADFTGESIYFRQSGLYVTNFITCTTNSYDDSTHMVGRSRYFWPMRIIDRNSNGLSFNYTNDILKLKSSSSASYSTSGFKQDHGSAMLKPINAVTNERSNIALVMQKESSPFVTSISQKNNGTAVRQPVQFTYTTNTIANELDANDHDMDIVLLTSTVFPDGSVIRYTYTNVLNVTTNGTAFTLPWLHTIVTPVDTTVFEYSFHANLSDNLYGLEDRKQYEPYRIKVISNAGSSTQVYEKADNPIFSTSTGLVEMRTITGTGTTNIKQYALSFDRGSLQWIGMESANTLDGLIHNRYEFDLTRLLYSRAFSSPDNGATFYTNCFDYNEYTENVVRHTDPVGNESRLNYSANGMDMVESIDPKGIITSNEYDAKGNLTLSIEDAEGFRRMVSNKYNTVGQVIKTIDPLGRIARNFYSTSLTPGAPSTYASGEPQTSNYGWLNATRDPLGRVTTYTYDSRGNQLAVNTPGRSASERYAVTNSYDDMDRPTATLFPDGTYISNVYNAAGYPIAVSDRAGRWTSNSYDAAGHVLRVDHPNGDWVEKDYCGDLVTKLTDGAHNVTRFYYDHEQLTGVEFPDGSKRIAGFDNLNRQIWAVDERGMAVTNTYDPLSRIQNIQYLPFYDVDTMPQTACMPPDSFNTSIISFDAASVYPAESTNYSVSYLYDTIGNITNLTDWTSETLYFYDRLNRCTTQLVSITSLTPSLKYTNTFTYDILDNRTNIELYAESFKAIQAYGYDTLNRLTNIIVNTSTLSSDPINTVYRYNQNGKLSSKFTDNGSLIRRELYSYDTEQRLKSLITSNSTKRLIELAYEYNNAQQITQILESVQVDTAVFRCSTNAFIYDNRDQLSRERHYSSIATLQYTNNFTYDHAQNRTIRTLDGLGETCKTDTYFYAIANKLKAIDETKQYDNDGISVSDELYHGTDPCDSDTDNDGWTDDYEINTANTNPWDPDSDGDRTVDGSDTQPLIPNNGIWFNTRSGPMPQHWWTGSTSKPQYQHETNATYKYFYDIAGNLASNIENGTLVTYYYNAQNKLTKIEKGSTVYEFLYDSQNRRIGIKKSGEWLFDIHDGMIPVAQLSENGSVWSVDRYFIRGIGIAEGTGDVIAEIDDNGDAHYYCANHRGDTIAVLSDTGSMENYFQYDAFGDLVYTENATGFKPRYTFSTKEHIAEINGMLYAYRLYLIDCGRWTQRDPIDYQDSINLYQFCGNNPVNGLDPWGLYDKDIKNVLNKIANSEAMFNDVCLSIYFKIAQKHLLGKIYDNIPFVGNFYIFGMIVMNKSAAVDSLVHEAVHAIKSEDTKEKYHFMEEVEAQYYSHLIQEYINKKKYGDKYPFDPQKRAYEKAKGDIQTVKDNYPTLYEKTKNTKYKGLAPVPGLFPYKSSDK